MSITRLFQRALELEREKRDIIHLEVGQLDLSIPRRIRELTPRSHSPYGDTSGMRQLREAISRYCARTLSLAVSVDEILVTPGGRFAIYATLAGCLSYGQKVLTLDPSWPGYAECAHVAHVKLERLPTQLESGWSPDLSRLEEKIKQGAKLIILNYPNNPTGKVLEKDAFEAIQDIVKKNDVLVLRDEAYIDYNFLSHKLPSMDLSNTVSVFTFSKSFAMAGFRLGFTIANKDTISRLSKVHSAIMTSVNHYSQRAGIVALQDDDILSRNAKILKSRIKMAASILKGLGLRFYYPEGGMYVFVKMNKRLNTLKFANDLLEKRGVAVVPGVAFGSYPEFLRISLGTSTQRIREGLKILGQVIGN